MLLCLSIGAEQLSLGAPVPLVLPPRIVHVTANQHPTCRHGPRAVAVLAATRLGLAGSVHGLQQRECQGEGTAVTPQVARVRTVSSLVVTLRLVPVPVPRSVTVMLCSVCKEATAVDGAIPPSSTYTSATVPGYEAMQHT